MFTIPVLNTTIEPAICYSGAFSNEEIANIIEMGDHQQFMEAKVGSADLSGGSENKEIRNSQVSWIEPHQETSWLFNKTVEIISRINSDKFQFELSHIDKFQYTTYQEGGFYSWHVDADNLQTFGPNHRKLGVSIMLSDPTTDFTGGEFQIIPGGNPNGAVNMTVKKGDVLVFPGFIPHQVNKVLTGERKSLVCWVLGPKFK
jgi:predicted 2-oxoglutarate/Fe(II)-dependent dioxygenase YbiX